MKKWFFLLLVLFLPLFSWELDVKEQTGTGVGYQNHYTAISLYHPFEVSSWAPFIDGRLLFFNQGRVGFNLGGGTQYLFSERDAIGGHGYVDFRKGPDHYSFWQLTPGLSYAHRFVSSQIDYGDLQLFANGYFPVRWRHKDVAAPTFNRFEGNHLLINRIDRIALTGMNVEVGYRTPSLKGWRLYVAGSPYYFKRGKINTKLRALGKLTLSYKELFSIEGMISHDAVFGTRLSGVFKLSIPLSGKGMEQAKQGKYRSKTAYPPKRFEQIVLTKTEETITARDAQGTPLNFLFVNNLSNSLGTFESPFPTLLQAEQASKSGDFIYVFSGDGTTSGMDQGILLKTSQTLAGSGTTLPVTTQIGSVTIPTFTASKPTITNTGGSGVQVNDLCYVSGIRVLGANVHGFTQVDRDQLSATLESCEAIESQQSGFRFNANNTTATFDLAFSNCLSKNNGLAGSSDGFEFFANGDQSTLKATLIQSTAQDENRYGFAFTTIGATSQMTNALTHCQVSGSGDDSFFFNPTGSSQMTNALTNCRAPGSGGRGFVFQTIDSPQVTNFLTHCETSNSVGDGFQFFSGISAQMTNALTHCQASGSGTKGFFFNPEDSSQMTTALTHSQASGSGGAGFEFVQGASSQMTNALTHCQASGSGDDGFFFNPEDSSQMTNALTHCQASGSGDIGFEFAQGASSQMTNALTDCQTSGNNDNGIYFLISNTSQQDNSLVNCIFENNGNRGLEIDAALTSPTGRLVCIESIFQNNTIEDFLSSGLAESQTLIFDQCRAGTASNITARATGSSNFQLSNSTFPAITVDGASATDLVLEGHSAPSITLQNLTVETPPPPSLQSLQEINPDTTVIDGGGVTFVN